jgi:hypothetical protein
MSGRAPRSARFAAAALATAALGLPASSAAAPERSGSVKVTNVALKSSWRMSWLTASVKFTITIGSPATVDVAVRPAKSGPVAGHAVYTLGAGATTETIKLPPRLVPGDYTLHVVGAPLTRFTIPTPPEGVADTAEISLTKGGKSLTSVDSPKELWVRFHFLARPPAANTVTIVWKIPGFRYVGKVNKPYSQTIDSDLSSGKAFAPGTYYAYLKVGPKITRAKEIRVT